MNDMSDVFLKLESNDPSVVGEIQQFIKEQYQAVQEPWLVSALYDAFLQTSSSRCLELILEVNEPHDVFLLDKIFQDLVHTENHRLPALTILGYVIRKQPPWVHKISEHAVMKELINILKNEDNTEVIMNGLLDLLALMPIVPVNIGKFLPDLFEIFSRVAAWRYQCVKTLPDVLKIHLQVGLFAFFHRLYGMFPCNFLAFLRGHYSDVDNKDNQTVFSHTIRPMLKSVAMHPLLVTHSRELEKSATRWRKMELHDVIVEPSKLLHDVSRKSDLAIMLDLEDESGPNDKHTDPYGLFGTATEDPLWTPTRRFEMVTPPLGNASQPSKNHPNQPVSMARRPHDSPPEAAIEATPESTPFVTPIKDEKFKFARPVPCNQVSRQLHLDVVATREDTSSQTTHQVEESTTLTEPQSIIQSSLGFPGSERRDSLFHDKILSEMKNFSKELTANETVQGTNDPIEESIEKPCPTNGDASRETPQDVITPPAISDLRPSPVKFTSQRPKQFPLRPKPERYPPEVVKHKMMQLDSLKDALTDSVREEDDEEVTEITGGKDRRPNELSTRHITPQIYTDSGATSRTVSRLSSSSQVDCGPKIDIAFFQAPLDSDLTTNYDSLESAQTVSVTPLNASSDCKSGGLHPPSRDTVSNFVRQLSGRIRYASICASSATQADLIAEVEQGMGAGNDDDPIDDEGSPPVRRRSSSCPEQKEIINILNKRKEILIQANSNEEPVNSPPLSAVDNPDGLRSFIPEDRGDQNPRTNEYSQTDSFLVYPYEHLFLSALPTWFTNIQKDVEDETNITELVEDSRKNPEDFPQESDNPYEILDHYIMKSYENNFKNFSSKQDSLTSNVLRDEIFLLRSHLMYDQYQREIIGVRNRRLIGKTRHSRILEEQNFALKDKFEIVKSEIEQLRSELETLRHQKKVVEEERIKNDDERNKEIWKLADENETLKGETSDLQVLTRKRDEDLRLASKEILRLEAALFNATSEVGRVSTKEDRRSAAERKANVLKRERSTLVRYCKRYAERARPGSGDRIDGPSRPVDPTPKLNGLNAAVVQKRIDVEALAARERELKRLLASKDRAAAHQTALLGEVKAHALEKLEASEAAYAGLMDHQLQLEKKVFDLEKQLFDKKRANVGQTGSGFASRPRNASPEVSGGVGVGAGVAASASVAIRDPRRSEPKESNVDGTFVIGSPPSSSGSDRSDLFRGGFGGAAADFSGSPAKRGFRGERR